MDQKNQSTSEEKAPSRGRRKHLQPPRILENEQVPVSMKDQALLRTFQICFNLLLYTSVLMKNRASNSLRERMVIQNILSDNR